MQVPITVRFALLILSLSQSYKMCKEIRDNFTTQANEMLEIHQKVAFNGQLLFTILSLNNFYSIFLEQRGKLKYLTADFREIEKFLIKKLKLERKVDKNFIKTVRKEVKMTELSTKP